MPKKKKYKVGDVIKLDEDTMQAIEKEHSFIVGNQMSMLALTTSSGKAHVKMWAKLNDAIPELKDYEAELDYANQSVRLSNKKYPQTS